MGVQSSGSGAGFWVMVCVSQPLRAGGLRVGLL